MRLGILILLIPMCAGCWIHNDAEQHRLEDRMDLHGQLLSKCMRSNGYHWWDIKVERPTDITLKDRARYETDRLHECWAMQNRGDKPTESPSYDN